MKVLKYLTFLIAILSFIPAASYINLAVSGEQNYLPDSFNVAMGFFDRDSSETTNSNSTSETIKIASWNIRDFGKSKATDPFRMRKMASIINGFDIIAIQEISNIREQADPGCPRNENDCPGHGNCNLIRNALELYLNTEQSANYRFIFSPQIKDERYLFIYDPDTVTLIEASLVVDPGDSQPICASSPANTGRMVRQPFKGRFRAGSFDFVLLTAHTRPSDNVNELEGLEDFYKDTESRGEPDIIILGDLNADCEYLGPSDNVDLKGPEYI